MTPLPNRLAAEAIDAFFLGLSATWPEVYTVEQQQRDFNDVFMRSAGGRRVLYRLLDHCNLYANPLAEAMKIGTPPELVRDVMCQAIGRQDVARFILSVLTAPPPVEGDATAQTTPDEGAKQGD